MVQVLSRIFSIPRKYYPRAYCGSDCWNYISGISEYLHRWISLKFRTDNRRNVRKFFRIYARRTLLVFYGGLRGTSLDIFQIGYGLRRQYASDSVPPASSPNILLLFSICSFWIYSRSHIYRVRYPEILSLSYYSSSLDYYILTCLSRSLRVCEKTIDCEWRIADWDKNITY